MTILLIKYTICGVSMVLTALFALAFTGSTLDNLANGSVTEWLSASLLVTTGFCIDSGKYLFWSNRHLCQYFAAISLALALFSWLASLAFFMAGETALITKKQQSSPEYNAYLANMSALRKEISDRQALVSQKLNSRYHDQWQSAEEQLSIISEKKAELSILLAKKDQIAKHATFESLPSQQLFASTAGMFRVEVNHVRIFFFAVLALLIEICALGVIALSSWTKKEQSTATSTDEGPDRSFHKDTNKRTVREIEKPLSTEQDQEQKSKRSRLIHDIITGNIEPVLRKIKMARYGIPLDDTREILSNLEQQGILEEDIRNSYKLAECYTKSSQLDRASISANVNQAQ